jgi:hypothetical protein
METFKHPKTTFRGEQHNYKYRKTLLIVILSENRPVHTESLGFYSSLPSSLLWNEYTILDIWLPSACQFVIDGITQNKFKRHEIYNVQKSAAHKHFFTWINNCIWSQSILTQMLLYCWNWWKYMVDWDMKSQINQSLSYNCRRSCWCVTTKSKRHPSFLQPKQ